MHAIHLLLSFVAMLYRALVSIGDRAKVTSQSKCKVSGLDAGTGNYHHRCTVTAAGVFYSPCP